MKQFRKLGLILMIFMVSALLFNYQFVWADDDHDEYEEHKYKEYDDDDYEEYKYKEYDDDYEEYDEDDEYESGRYDNQYPSQPIQKIESWDSWSRSPINNFSYAQLPFLDERTAVIQFGDEDTTVNVIPFQGQIYVPLQELAKLVGAEFYQYDKINAAEIILNANHLIVKEGSRVIYENMKKTPMPQPTLSQNSAIYLPISVVANGLDFTVSWNEQEGFLLEEGVDEIAK